jgi:UDP-glucose 4-epimerase
MIRTEMAEQFLVTGGAGFIGSELTRLLLSRRGSVTVLDNLSFGKRENVWPGIRLVRGDIRKRRDLARALDRTYDAVFHLAALHFIPYCNAHPAETIDVNVEGTATLLLELRKRPPKKLFFASTAAVYDSSSTFHREDEPLDPLDVYGTSKLLGENLVRLFHRDSAVPCAIGRLFNAYGPRETNPHLIPHILAQVQKKARVIRLGNLSPYRDYIHTSDIADAIVRLTLRTRKGVRLANVASGEEYSVRQVVKAVSRVLGSRVSGV